MSAPGPHKLCPNCNSVCQVSDLTCSLCSHVFRSNFVPNPTVAIPAMQVKPKPNKKRITILLSVLIVASIAFGVVSYNRSQSIVGTWVLLNNRGGRVLIKISADKSYIVSGPQGNLVYRWHLSDDTITLYSMNAVGQGQETTTETYFISRDDGKMTMLGSGDQMVLQRIEDAKKESKHLREIAKKIQVGHPRTMVEELLGVPQNIGNGTRNGEPYSTLQYQLFDGTLEFIIIGNNVEGKRFGNFGLAGLPSR